MSSFFKMMEQYGGDLKRKALDGFAGGAPASDFDDPSKKQKLVSAGQRKI